MSDTHVLKERFILDIFRISIFLKGVLSFVEILAGTIILFVDPAAIGNAIVGIIQDELADEPNSFLALHTLPLAQQFALTPKLFLAFYLLSRGLIKLVLVIALLKSKLWAYPAALAVLGLFMLYQTVEIVLKHSPFMIALTLFDVVVMWLIWHEYQIVSARKSAADTPPSTGTVA